MELSPPVDHSSLIQNAIDMGVGFADASYMYWDISSLTLSEGRIKNKNVVDFGTSLRMISGGVENFIGTNKYSEIGHSVSTLARKTSLHGERNPPEIYFANELNSTVDISDDNIVDKEYGGEPLAFLKEIERMNDLKEISIKYEFDHSKIGRFYYSSDPITINQVITLDILKILLEKKTSKGRITTSLSFGGVSADNLNLEKIKERMDKSISFLNSVEQAKVGKGGLYNTVLSSDSAWTLIHETIGHAIEADEIIKGNSFIKEFKNQIITSLELTVIDDSQIKSSGWSEFDDEGMKTKGTLIIDNGELSQFIHSRRTAQIMGEIPTGNGRLSNYLTKPKPRQTNLMVEAGDWSDEEIFEFVGEGLFIGPITHAQVILRNGEFIMIPEYAYEIKNGELGEPRLIQMIRGHTLETLQNIEAVGNRIQANPTECIKNGNSIPVGMISPIMMVRDMEVY